MIARRELRDAYVDAGAELLAELVCTGRADCLAAADAAASAAGGRRISEAELRALLRCATRLTLIASAPRALGRVKAAGPLPAEGEVMRLSAGRPAGVKGHKGALAFFFGRGVTDRIHWLSGPAETAAQAARIAARVYAQAGGSDAMTAHEAAALAEAALRLRDFVADTRWGFGCAELECPPGAAP